MRWLKPTLAVLMLLVLAAVASGDFNALDKGTHFQGASGQRVTSAGHATTVEQDPAMDGNLTFPSCISLSTLAGGAGDSSAVLDTHRMRLGTLLIKGTVQTIEAADSTNGGNVVRLGVQIRTHLQGASDSMSVFPFFPYGRTDIGSQATTASQTDTTVSGHLIGGVNHAATVNTQWSGEFIVLVDGNRGGPGGGAPATFSRAWSYPNGIAIPLSSIFGRDIYSPFTSVRIRNLGNGNGVKSIIVTASLVGTPL